MTSVIVDPPCTDDERRHALFSGDIFVHTHSPAIQAFVAFTRGMIAEAFDDRDPETAQHDMDVVEYAAVLAALKPAFIHHPESKTHLRAILIEHGCDPELTYFDVPRLRTSTSRQLPDHRHRLRLPPASRHVVLRTDDAAQLVAPDLRRAAGQRGRLPPALLRPGRGQRQRSLQLLRVEPRQPGHRRGPDRRRHPRPAQAGGADRPRPADPAPAARSVG